MADLTLTRRVRSWLARATTAPAIREDPIERGARGERLAYDFLRGKGYQILARNFRRPGVHGELDLVAWDEGTLVFVEVKTRRSAEHRAAEDAVDHLKRRALVRMSRLFRRYARLRDAPYRFDVVAVYPGEDSQPVVEHFRAAFREQDV